MKTRRLTTRSLTAVRGAGALALAMVGPAAASDPKDPFIIRTIDKSPDQVSAAVKVHTEKMK